MLTPYSENPDAVQARLRRRLRRHWDQPHLPTSLGCSRCPQKDVCGGIHTEIRQFDCLAYCCGKPEGCTKVCRKQPDLFTQQVREIGGFDLAKTPRAPALEAPALPPFAPVIYHRGKRQVPLDRLAVALPLYALFSTRTGIGKFASRDALCGAFAISPQTAIILTGTDQDEALERWWSYGEERRRDGIAYLRKLGIALVTTPNYSLFANIPRTDDIHSMKRIALVHSEFLQGGVPSALHINGRTETDFDRWATFLVARPEITHVAYEFGTGAGFSERILQHLAWLKSVARSVGRPLTLVVRGGFEILPALAAAYENVVFLDTAVFMKTMKRQRAVRLDNAKLEWQSSPTPHGACLSPLFEQNNNEREALVRLLTSPPASPIAV
jgi:Domain of unknown function (DUF4417)